MSIAPTPTTPASAIDPETGRLRPLTAVDRQARSAALAQAFDRIGGITDETDTDERWSEVFRGIDEGRPHRPLFKEVPRP